jgi:phage tail sheath protein FI
MPVAPTYPGVYIEEIPSGVHTITGVATSITAFVGKAQRGPLNKATTITSFSDYVRTFGGLWLDSAMSFAVRDFFLNGGSQAIIIRVFTPTFATAAAQQAAFTAAQGQAQTAADAVAKAAADAAALATPPPTPQSVAQAAGGAVKAAGATGLPAQDAAQAVADAATVAAQATNPVPSPTDVANAAKNAVSSAVASAATAAAPITRAQIAIPGGLVLEAKYEGAWGNTLRVRIDTNVSPAVAGAMNVATSALFNITVYNTGTGETEVFRNLTVIASSRLVSKVLANDSSMIQVVDPQNLPTSPPTPNSSKLAVGKDITNDDKYSTPVTSIASDGKAIGTTDLVPADGGASKTGIYALEDADLFNILCLPPLALDVDIEFPGISDAVAYCEKRRAILLLDPPSGWKTVADASSGVDGINITSKNAALYFPRLMQPNPLRSNQREPFAPCGTIAGILARTDTNRGVWKAPAGLVDGSVLGTPELTVLMTDAENGLLNPLGINCLRARPAAGNVVWGARTRQGDDRLASEWKYLPVRRTALFIEESLYRGTQWAVFEPNDEPLWAQLRLNIGSFMRDLFRKGAFQGSSPKDAYFVKCDKETTTQNDINLGIVNVIVGFAPLKPAEFVIIQLQQMAGQIDV